VGKMVFLEVWDSSDRALHRYGVNCGEVGLVDGELGDFLTV